MTTSDQASERAERARPRGEHLQRLLADIAKWFERGDLGKPAWFEAEHPRSASGWVVRIDVEPPTGVTQWYRRAELPVPNSTLANAPFAPLGGPAGEATDAALLRALRDWALQDAVAKLTDQERDCLELVVDGRMTVREAAALLGVSHPTVWRRLRSAKAKLRDDMDYWFD